MPENCSSGVKQLQNFGTEIFYNLLQLVSYIIQRIVLRCISMLQYVFYYERHKCTENIRFEIFFLNLPRQVSENNFDKKAPSDRRIWNIFC